MKKSGGVLITVRDSDKAEILVIVEKLAARGFSLYATRGTAKFLSDRNFAVETVEKIHDSSGDNTATLLESGKISYIISTSEKGRDPAFDDVKIRRKACSLGIPCLTSVDTANALADSLLSDYSEINTELIDINNLRDRRIELQFTKMHGCSNDYICINCLDLGIDCFNLVTNSPESLSVLLSDRHTGVGGEGIVLIMRSKQADARMRMFNLDGSEGGMGGNAIRCVAKYLYDNNIARKKHMRIETKSGIRELWLSTKNGLVSSVKVDMGCAELRPDKIPVKLTGENVIARPIDINGKKYDITCVSMGNPHAVVFVKNLDKLDLQEIGPHFENNALFPDRVNAEFVEIADSKHLKMRVWERGSGETLACGTGACAAVVAAVRNGHCEKGADIMVRLPGGELIINYTDETVFMTGECKKVFDGTVEI
jgi:carbamoyl-phosphate synthase large subunit